MTDTPTINFKRGDTFKLEIAVVDKLSTAAVAAQTALTNAEAAYQAALIAVPFVQATVDSTLITRDAAQVTYNAAIIVDITGWTITSKLNWCGKEVSVFTVTIVSAVAGTLTVIALPIVTALWNPREHEQDITFVTPSGTTSSENIIIIVTKGATNG